MEAISDIATDPTLDWKPVPNRTPPEGAWFCRSGLPGRWFVVGERGGVTIKVIIEPAGGGIVTAHPLS
jgi:hypothetical protein